MRFKYEYLYYRYSNLFYIRNTKMNNKYEYPYYSIRIDYLYSIFAYAYSYKYPYYGYQKSIASFLEAMDNE